MQTTKAMISFSNFLLVHVFTALLPSKEEDEYEYYEILGLSKSARFDDIKKAYRKKSLELHPDKVAQRRETNPEQAAAEYEKVQEAYGVLSDSERKNLYHHLGHSPARFKFANNGGLYNPVQCYQNLGKANVVDKTRLVGVVAVFAMLFLLQPILVAARVNQELEHKGTISDAPWVAILTPTWVFYSLILVFWGGLAILSPPGARAECIVKLLEHTSWLAGIILLAQNWDRPLSGKDNWHTVSIPFYIAIVLRVFGVAARYATVQAEFARMISPTHFQNKYPNYEDMSDEEKEVLNKQYRIIQVDTEAVTNTLEILREQGADITDDDVEAVRVTTSPEFEAMEEAAKSSIGPTIGIVLAGVPLIALIASKLEGSISGSWWVVFIPIWILIGRQVLLGVLLCCFAPVQGDQVVVINEEEADGENDVDDEKDTRDMRSSVQWATTEGNMNEFNARQDPSDSPSDEIPTTSIPTLAGTKPDVHLDAKIENEDEPESEVGKKKAADPPGIQADKIKRMEQIQAAKDAIAQNSVPEGVDKSVPVDEEAPDDGSDIELDEDTFRAFKKAQEEAEENAMNAQAKAQGRCCLALFHLTMLCLLVGKLEEDFDIPDESDTDEVGYSSFWILFPIFLIAGIVVCCCSCLIYMANGSELESALGDAPPPGADGTTAANTSAAPQGFSSSTDPSSATSTPIVLSPPEPTTESKAPAEPVSPMKETAEAENDKDEKGKETLPTQKSETGDPPVPAEDMNDLD